MRSREEGLRPVESLVALAGGFVALFGTYWDDAFHTDHGRDDLGSPPHLALYAGVAVGVAVAARWAVRARTNQHAWRKLLRDGHPALLALSGGVAVLVSAPVDEFWHQAYGRDAVLWSPPHLVATSASVALLIGLVLGIRSGTTAARVGAALVMGALLVPVMEYETDVPQFSSTLYLPVVVLGLALAWRPVTTTTGGRWPLTVAALWYTGFRIVAAAGLDLIGDTTPIVPPIVVAALLIDGVARVVSPRLRRVVPAAAVPVAYLPLLGVVPGSDPSAGADIAITLVLGLAAALMVSLIAVRPVPVVPMSAIVAVAALVLLAPPVWAHDPGQGSLRGEAEWDVVVRDLQVEMAVVVPDELCRRGPLQLVARRAGRKIETLARVRAGCTVTGTVVVDEPGRWFFYVERGRLESWLPVEAGSTTRTKGRRVVYERPARERGAAQPLAGATLIAVAAALIVLAVRTASISPAARSSTH